MTRSPSPPEEQKELSIAQSFILLTLKWPVKTDPLIALSDADFGLVGAIIIDLSISGQLDSDLQNLVLLEHAVAADPVQKLAMELLRKQGNAMPIDIAINTLADRVGDLRSACLTTLSSMNICLTKSCSLKWSFYKTSGNHIKVPAAEKLRRSLLELVESDEIPLPEQAAIIAILHACDILGPVLGGKYFHEWLIVYGMRIDTIRRMELIGHSVVSSVAEMRLRLRTYLLDSLERASAKATVNTAARNQDKNYTRSTTTWEWRAFWPEGENIELPASWGGMHINAHITEESILDNYLFVRGKKDNIKVRGKGLKVKPVLEAFDEFIAFGPSVKFRFPEKPLPLSVIFPRLFEVRRKLKNIDELLKVMSATGYRPNQITVSKTRQDLNMMFGVQIEFACIKVLDKKYHSISLESPYLTPLRILARNIAVGSGYVAGYSDFLERILFRGEGGFSTSP